MPRNHDDDPNINLDDDLSEDDEPLPVKRDVRIFSRKKDDEHKDKESDEEFEEDVFV